MQGGIKETGEEPENNYYDLISVKCGWTRLYVPSLERAASVPGSAWLGHAAIIPGKDVSSGQPVLRQGRRIDVLVV